MDPAERTRLPGRWYRLAFSAPKAGEDDVVGVLQLAGSLGLKTRPGGPRRLAFEAWFADESGALEARRLVGSLPGVRVGDGPVEPIEDPGWLAASLVPRGALAAGRFVVYDDEHAPVDTESGRIPILLPLGRAFGTGEHATTRMCLELLDALLPASGRVLDMGTGSAILAIAAAKAGASGVLALDNDPNVIDVALENLALNGVADRVTVGAGSWTSVPAESRFDLVLANIHRTALVRGAHALASRLDPGGRAILSGFHVPDAPVVRAAWEKAGLSWLDERHDGEWCAMALRKP